MGEDNAGNGLRGLRAAPSSELAALLRERYGFDSIDAIYDLGGSSNLNLLITTDTGRYVARIYRPYVSMARLEAIHSVRRALAGGSVPCAEGVPARDGAAWTERDGRLIEVERFVESDQQMDSWKRLALGLPWLGRIHSLLRGVSVNSEGKNPLFANHIEPFDTLTWTRRGTDRVRSWGPTHDELRLVEAAEELAQRVFEAEQDLVSSLPRQLVHGDFWDNNVFFRKSQVVLVTDLDFMGERARIDDLALTLYFTSAKFSEDRDSDALVSRLRGLMEAYDSGLDVPLTDAERTALPLAMARQPLWWIGRWLALLDDEDEARQGFAGMLRDVQWALRLMQDIERWQAAFA